MNVLGDMVAIEVSIQGTFLGPLGTPAGIVQPTGAKVDVPTADFWYLRDGKIEMFDCYVMVSTMLAQVGVMPDFASAAAARRADVRRPGRALPARAAAARVWRVWPTSATARASRLSCSRPRSKPATRRRRAQGRGDLTRYAINPLIVIRLG